jgi:hypothetical protein
MVDIQSIPRLHRRAFEAYEKYCAIKEEEKRLNARLQELTKARKQEEATLATQFGTGDSRRLPNNIILTRKVITVPDKIVTPDMVGSVVTKGYSYALYKEIKG